MDKQTLAVMIPLFALAIPLLAITFAGLTKLARIRNEQGRVADADAVARLVALEEQVGLLQQHLSETQERLDFAERLLARPRQDSPPG